MSAAKALILKHNQLKLTEHSFDNLDQLMFLDIQYNQLADFPFTVFCSLTTLIRLDLSHNTMEFLPKAQFACLANLRELILSHNSLRTLDYEVFMGLHKLKYLLLQGLSLTVIHLDMLADFLGLDVLNLSSAGSVQLTSCETTPNVQTLDLS